MLNIKKINALKVDKVKDFKDISNLFLRVYTTGKKVWYFRYTKPNTKKRTWLLLGIYPALSLGDARVKCEEYRVLIYRGIDPQEHLRHQKEHTRTFQSVAEEWFAWRKQRNDFGHKTAKQSWRLLELYILPKLGNVAIGDITAPMALVELDKIHKAGKPETCRRTLGKMREVMTYALNLGIIDGNPIATVNAMFDRARVTHFNTLHYNDLSSIFQALAHKKTHLSYALLLWQLFNLSRPAEAAGTKWEDIEPSEQVWSYHVLKGNKENDSGRIHKVPLTKQAINVLDHLRKYHHTQCVFPHRTNPNKHITPLAVNKLLNDCGFGGKQTAHGFRRMASTWLNEQLNADGTRKYDAELIEVALSHIDRNTVRSAYNSAEYLERRRRMLQDWADFVERAGGSL